MYIYDTYEKSLWRSDGTPNGTFTIMKGNRIYKLSELNSKVYFFALNKNDYAEFWQTDGTVNGTQLIKTLASQKKTFGNWPSFTLFKFNNKLLFDGIDDLNGLQLWETDGTDNGTKLLRKLAPASTFAMNISNFIIVNNVLYFGAKDSMENHRLWKSDGTELGTNTFLTILKTHITILLSTKTNCISMRMIIVLLEILGSCSLPMEPIRALMQLFRRYSN